MRHRQGGEHDLWVAVLEEAEEGRFPVVCIELVEEPGSVTRHR
jgi:hypothetical protein